MMGDDTRKGNHAGRSPQNDTTFHKRQSFLAQALAEEHSDPSPFPCPCLMLREDQRRGPMTSIAAPMGCHPSARGNLSTAERNPRPDRPGVSFTTHPPVDTGKARRRDGPPTTTLLPPRTVVVLALVSHGRDSQPRPATGTPPCASPPLPTPKRCSTRHQGVEGCPKREGKT